MWWSKRRKRDNQLEKQINQAVKDGLAGYVTLDELEKKLTSIQNNDDKRRIWEGLSVRKKIAVLKKALNKNA